MKTLEVTWKGTTPLLMNNVRGVNPLLPLCKEKKKYTSKRTKTDEDLEIISDLEWEIGLYWHDDIGVYVPSEAIEATIRNGAKANKKGLDIVKFVNVKELMIPLDYGTRLTLDELRKDYTYRDVRAVQQQRVRIMKTRPRFNRWGITFTLIYDENRIDFDTIASAVEFAGMYVGFCDYRPRYGKFTALIEEMD